jgi:glycerol-3-phosphate dehydrogenase
VHGGERYLEQGNISLAMKRSASAAWLLRNTPILAPIALSWRRTTTGGNRVKWPRLRVYNLLAGKYGFGTSRILSKEETLERMSTIETGGLRGGDEADEGLL